MLRLKNSGAEVTFLWVNPTSAAIALKTAATIGFKPQWISSDTLMDFPLMNKITGGLWEGVITGGIGLPTDVDHPLMNKYRAAAKKYAPEERFGVFYTAGIMFAEPLVDALKRVGPKLSTEALLRELNKTKNFQGLGAVVNWSPTVHQGCDSIQILKCGRIPAILFFRTGHLTNWQRGRKSNIPISPEAGDALPPTKYFRCQ